MTILQNPRANPGVARVLFRQLAAVGGECARNPLLMAIAPPGAGWYEPGKVRGDVRDETLEVCVALGLVQLEKDVVTLAVPAEDWTAGDSVAAFRRVLRRLLFEASADQNPFDDGGLAEFAGAIAWFLTQQPLRPFYSWARSARGAAVETAQADCLSHERRLLTGDRQWDALVRWGGFLGFVAEVRRSNTTADAAIPDPSVAIADELDSLPPDDASAWLDRLAGILPVVDGGSLRARVEAEMRPEAVPGFVSPSLSLALERLRAERRISVENVPDAPAQSRVVLHFGEDQRVASRIGEGDG